jgi:hypothetical protein
MILTMIKIVKKVTNQEMTRLVEVCLRSIFFRFQGGFFEKPNGVVVSSPLSITLEN